MLQGVVQRYDFETSKQLGEAKLNKFVVDAEAAKATRLRAIINGRDWEYVPQGEYIQLFVDGVMMMSDTRIEKETSAEFVEKAHGDVFVAGLGVGLILHNIKDKVEKGIVKSITIVEISQDVIDLVSKYYTDFDIKYICADIMNYKPKKDEKYDTMFFDIWPAVDIEMLDDMRKLSYTWRSHKKDENSWIGYWAREQARRIKYSDY